MDKAIGGYFELELPATGAYHPEAIALNTARNCLEYILEAKGYKKVFMPYYTCDVLLQPIAKLKIECEFYNIDENLEPIFDFTRVEANMGFLYTNYYGLKDQYIKSIAAQCANLIVDNAQAFFAKPLAGVPTFYSARKFFGVPDGAYLYTDVTRTTAIEQDYSHTRCAHLIERIDLSAEQAYVTFGQNEHVLDTLPLRTMSTLTHALLNAIDYESVKSKRLANFQYLHNKLHSINQFSATLDQDSVPLSYPLLVHNKVGLRTLLIQHKVYTPTYWPNVLTWCKEGDIEFELTQQLIHLPIDQRVSCAELDFMVDIILNKI